MFPLIFQKGVHLLLLEKMAQEKSTIAQLISRLYDVENGKILIDE